MLRSIAVTACLMAAFVVGGCGSDSGGSSGSGASSGTNSAAPKNLVKDGSLTVCTDPSYPPLEYFGQNKELAGFDVAVARAAADKLGIEAVFKPTGFNGILPALDSGRCDVAWSGLFLDPERTKRFIAIPYQETKSVILVRTGNPAKISSPDDLAGKTVASQNGSNLLKKARTISADLVKQGKPASKVQGYDKFEQAIQQLVVGRADAVITQDIDAAFRALKQPDQFESAYGFPDSETFGVYIKPDNGDLENKLHKALDDLQKSGDLERLAKQEGMPTDGIGVKAPVGGSA